MNSSRNRLENKMLERSVPRSSRKANIKELDKSQSLSTLAANITYLLKIIILVILFLTILFIFLKIYSQQGIVILPFEMGTNKNLSGVAIADQITAELVRIHTIHNTNYEKEIILKNQTEWQAELSTGLFLGKGGMIVPKEDLIKFSMANTGTISTGYGSLDPGKIIVAFKDICPYSKPDTIIRGSLQRYGPNIVLIALLEGNIVKSWIVRGPVDSEDLIQEMIRDLAFMIVFDLPDSKISSKTWEAFKYYTEALDAYSQYQRTKNPVELSVASNYSLRAIEFENGYQNPFDLLLALELEYCLINDYHSAIYYCDTITTLYPELASGWENKGIIFYNLGKYNESIDAFDKAIKINSSHLNALNNRGLAYARLEDYGKAVDSYDTAIQINPQFLEAWNNKGAALYEWGIRYNDPSKYDDAIKTFNKALEINPQYADVLTSKGKALYQQYKYDDAIKVFEKAIKINPQDADAWYVKGLALDNQSKHNKAIKAFEKAIEINPQDSDAWRGKGFSLYKQKNYDDAIKAFDKVIEINRQDTNAWLCKSWPLYQLKNYSEAIVVLNESIRLDPNNAAAWNTKFLVLNESGRSYEADLAKAKAKELGHAG